LGTGVADLEIAAGAGETDLGSAKATDFAGDIIGFFAGEGELDLAGTDAGNFASTGVGELAGIVEAFLSGAGSFTVARAGAFSRYLFSGMNRTGGGFDSAGSENAFIRGYA
jgi:hypothetical protein